MQQMLTVGSGTPGMTSFFVAFTVAGVVGSILTPLVRRFALHIGAVAHPGGRHIHNQTVARLGGLAICMAVLTPLLGLLFVESAVAEAFTRERGKVLGLLAGGVILCAVGVIDDIRGLRALHKLYFQIAVALLAFACGFRIQAISLPFVNSLDMGVFALPITIVWIVGIINAVNLIDGLDGLAAGVVFFAGLTNFIIACISGSTFVAVVMAATLGAVIGFLFYNFNPARIFMGDSGSYFLGYVLAVMSLSGATTKASTAVSLLVPVVALGVPIFDTLFAMVRRILEKRSIFSPDRGHIHHRLLDMGITHRRAVLIIYGVSIVFTVSAIAISLGRSWHVGLAMLAASVVLVGLVRFVGYFEYVHLRKRQEARILSRDTMRLRYLMPTLSKQLDVPRSRDDLLEGLGRALKAAGIGFYTIRETSKGPPRVVFRWSNPAQTEVMHREAVTARYPIGRDGLERADIEFGWLSDDGDVSPQMAILLQVVTDTLEINLRRIRSSLAPRTADDLLVSEAAPDVVQLSRDSQPYLT